MCLLKFSLKNIRIINICLFVCSFSFQGLTFGLPNGVMDKKNMPQLFSELIVDYEKSLFDYSPEWALFWGKTDVALDRFMDNSLQGYQMWWQKEDDFLANLDTISTQDLKSPELKITYLLLKDHLAAKQASRICKTEFWDVNPAAGWHNRLAIVAQKQPVGTPEYRQAALQRWQGFPHYVNNEIANLKLGLSLGYSAPKPAVLRVLTQLKIVLNSPIEDSPYYDFALRDTDVTFKQQVYDLVQNTIHPALQHYVDYLEQDYLPVARNEIGLASLPDGHACYAAKIKEETTLAMTPTEIHDFGLYTMQNLMQEVGHIGMKKYGQQEMKPVFTMAYNESLHAFSSEEDILNYNFAALNRAKQKIPLWFASTPQTEGIIKPYPEYRAKTGASGEYLPPNDTRTEPGVFYINTYDPKNHARIDQEATLFHELIPGHHFQIALHYENPALVKLNRYLFNSGFGEGWALYVERLADEMGLYQDEISRLGMLSNEALRSARLVVDTGIHAFHWSREQAIDYLKQHTALSDSIIEGEVDRYIMLPGQATSYMLGKYTIERLRKDSEAQLGERFDIRQFHHQVLKNGAITLPMLEEQIKDWLNSQKILTS